MRLLFTILENNLEHKCGGNIKIYEESCSGLGGKLSVLAMRIVGGGLSAPVQNSSFTKIRKQLLNVTCDVAHKFMTDTVEEEIELTQNSSKETVEVDDLNQEAIRRLSIENLEQEDMSENESELTNTPDEVVACTRNIGVQGDGTWQRRGHRSYNGCFPHTVYSAIHMKKFMDLKGLQNGKNGLVRTYHCALKIILAHPDQWNLQPLWIFSVAFESCGQ
ncbi:hypothetical protein TSAR_000452 [Trichomalopsis sarcophagae]|uniref:Uncharacterized protein n=1 Tax=Trichomalopsis sarcophagae TaxID=543379 RepID=A0A232F5F8_9HYME|nr:hypothetical protein TSAR_000452 [Trichomalopsis sarcophagae]